MKIAKLKCNDDDDEDCDYEKLKNQIRVVHNNVYFYSRVSCQSVLELNIKLEEVQQSILNKSLSEQDINVYIHSGGGDLYAGISAMNYIESMKVHVNTIIDGYVASAASLIALGGHTVYMNKYGILLIHQISSGFYGKYNEFVDEFDNTKLSMRMMKTIYEDKTKIPKDILDQYLKKDIYIDSKICKQYKIIDKIF